MAEVIKPILDFFAKSSRGRILMFVGTLLLIYGIIGPVDIKHYPSPVGAWRIAAVSVGTIFLGLTVIQFSLSRLRYTLIEKLVREVGGKISENVDKLVIAANDKLDKHNAALLESASSTLLSQTRDLQEAEKHLVAQVEDATRHPLRGIPQIFDRAYKLLQKADKEIWMINFVLQFGKIHCVNPKVINSYKEQFDRDFNQDVADFYDILQLKAKQVPAVNILTISAEGALDNFLMPLLQRDEYRPLTSAYAESLQEMAKAKTLFISDIKNDRKDRFRTPHQYRVYERKSLPIQLLIAGLKPDNGGSDKRFGCLVFMVGSDSLNGTDSGSESGFYTELESMVDIMKNLARALMKNTVTLCDETESLATGTMRLAS